MPKQHAHSLDPAIGTTILTDELVRILHKINSEHDEDRALEQRLVHSHPRQDETADGRLLTCPHCQDLIYLRKETDNRWRAYQSWAARKTHPKDTASTTRATARPPITVPEIASTSPETSAPFSGSHRANATTSANPGTPASTRRYTFEPMTNRN